MISVFPRLNTWDISCLLLVSLLILRKPRPCNSDLSPRMLRRCGGSLGLPTTIEEGYGVIAKPLTALTKQNKFLWSMEA